MKKITILFLLLLIPFYSFSINLDQRFHISINSVNEGLSQFDAPSIIQDNYGFIWISTYDGLNRYDGNAFVQYRHDPFKITSINGNRVLVLYVDAENNFWVITESGKIDKFNYQNEQFEHFDFAPLKYSIITTFFEDKHHNYWIGTTNGLYKTSQIGNQFKVDGIYFNSTTPGFENFILSLVENENGGILVGTISGGFLLSNKGNQIFSPSKFYDNINVNSFCKDENNKIWICHNLGLSFINKNKISKNGTLDNNSIEFLANFSIRDIKAMKRIDKNNYIVLSGNSINQLNISTGIVKELKLNDMSFFKNNIIKSILIDRTKNIWISSGQKGVAKIDLLQKPNLITGKNETEGAFVKSVFKDSHGRVWVGTNLNGMYYYDVDGILKNLTVDGSKNLTYISPSIMEDKRGNVWFCANSDVYCYDYSINKAVSIRTLYKFSEKAALPFSLAIDKFDNLWIGYSSGVMRVNLSDRSAKNQFISIGSLSDMVSSEQISRMIYDPIHNIVWACTKDNGITVISLDKKGDVLKTKRLVHSENSNSISSDHVWSIVLASDSSVWFGTDSGLNKCTIEGDNLTVTPMKSLKTVGNVKIMSIAEDQSQNLWLGTSQALYSYNFKTHIEKRFTIANGLFSSAVLEGMYADKTGILYVGTTNGLNFLNTLHQERSPYVSDVQLVDFKIFGKSIKNDSVLNKHLKCPLYDTDKIELKYSENNFSISFLATHYNDFDRNMYVYKLEGFDADSIMVDSKNRTVQYNNLPAGTYHFWVKASNNDNNWGGKKKYLTIIVRSAPWLTFWAYLAYLSIIISILYFIYTYLSRETKLKQQLVIKELENQHQNEINNVRLRFHTNIAHDIRTPLTLIAGPLEDVKNNKLVIDDQFLNDRIGIVDKNVARLLYLVNQFLDFRRLLNDGSQLHPEVHVVSSVFNDIKKSFEGIAQTKKIHFEFVIDVNDNRLIFDVDKLTKILFNLISNAFKYTPDKGDIFVFVEQQNDFIVLRVQDTGCGISAKDLPKIFDRFYQSSESSSGTGIGLALVRQLVELCKGTIDVQSSLGEGSQFVVTLPCEIPIEIIQDEQSEDIIEAETEIEPETKDKRRAMVLIVEDDDDLRTYLVKCLKDKFTVIQGINGKEGFDKALRYTPDIILTDLMMPIIDGIGLIGLIRGDYRTSHIPIIVLTAKSGENDEIKALEAGAEDFISKPFSTKSVLLKVNNYLRNLSGNKNTSYEKINTKVVDREQVFLNQMNKVVLENLENPIFSIDFICEKLFISRMQLHRKIVALLGKSTSEYIREIKLDEAKKHFEKGEKDIESVMLMIGVNSSFHFNKNFKARFGISIQEFIKSLKRDN